MLPRCAYFEIHLDVSWWLQEARGVVFTHPSHTWSAKFSFRLHAFADGVDPLPEESRASPEYKNMHDNGIVDPVGGPVYIVARRDATAIHVRFDPGGGDPLRWTGALESLSGKTPTPMRHHFGLTSHCKILVMSPRTGEQRKVKVVLRFTDETTKELKVTQIAATLQLVKLVEKTPVSTQSLIVRPEFTGKTNGDDRETITFEVPLPQGEGATSHELRSLSLQLTYTDTAAADTPAIEPPTILGGSTPELLPGEYTEFQERLVYESKDEYHVEVAYEATLFHTGEEARIVFAPTKASLRSSTTGRQREVEDVLLDEVYVQFVRNEGEGAPNENGSSAGPFVERLTENLDDGTFELRSRDIQLFDRLTARFTTVETVGSQERALSEAEFREDLGVRWSYGSEAQAAAFHCTALIKSVRATITMAMDGDAIADLYVPLDSTRPGRRSAFLPVALEGGVLDVSWLPDFRSRYNERFDPESDIVAAIDACKSK